MSGTRLRSAFKYPDEDEAEPAEGIDEEEQEKLISSIHAHDAAQTELYMKIFLALPLLTILLYLPPLFAPSSSRFFLKTFLCISSLLFTAFILWFYPVRAGLTWQRSQQPGYAQRNIKDQLLDFPPSQLHTVILNGALSGILALQSYLLSSNREYSQIWPPPWLPACIFAIVCIARTQLRPVDVEELEKLKYDYKGA